MPYACTTCVVDFGGPCKSNSGAGNIAQAFLEENRCPQMGSVNLACIAALLLFFFFGGGGGASRDRTAIESKKQPLRWLVQNQKVVCSAAYYH